MREQAKSIVLKDMVYEYIVEAEGLTITAEEKSRLFDKYVDKYVSDYGYSRDYVLTNMETLITDSMLYDKTMEFLME